MQILIKFLADYLLLLIVPLAGYALLFKAPKYGKYDRYTRVLMAGLTSYWLAKVIGSLWQPETLRPFEQQGVQAGASYLGNAGFPSDHVLFAMFLTLAVWYVTRKPRLAIALLVMTLAMGLGRVLALVHTPLDVIGGIVIALLGAVWYLDFKQKIPQSKLAKTSNK